MCRRVSIRFRFLWAVLFLAAFCGCEPDRWSSMVEVVSDRFTGSSKVCLDGLSCTWEPADPIFINGTLCEVVRHDGKAWLRDVAVRSVNRAVYPAALATGDLSADATSLTLPTEYHYRTDASGHQLLDVPMAARSEGDSPLCFRHLTGALCFILTDTSSVPLILESLEVVSNRYQLNGPLSIDFRHIDTLTARRSSNEVRRCVRMVFNNDTLHPGATLRVVLPVAAVGADNRFVVTVRARHQGVCYKTIRGQGTGDGVDRALARNEMGYAALSIGRKWGVFEDIVPVSDTVMLISTPHQFMLMAEAVSNEWYRPGGNSKYNSLATEILADLDFRGDTLLAISGYGHHFEGGGHILRNLVIRSRRDGSTTTFNCGLFAKCGNSMEVRRLTLDRVTLLHADAGAATLSMGAICGRSASRLYLRDCSVRLATVEVVAVSSAVDFGGLVGRIQSDNLVVERCALSHPELTLVPNSKVNWGGFVGYHAGTGVASVSRSSWVGSATITTSAEVNAGGAEGNLAASGRLVLSLDTLDGTLRVTVPDAVTGNLAIYIGRRGRFGALSQSQCTTALNLYLNGTLLSSPPDYNQ